MASKNLGIDYPEFSGTSKNRTVDPLPKENEESEQDETQQPPLAALSSTSPVI